MHSICISFVKGWGKHYTRQDIMKCPCWLEISFTQRWHRRTNLTGAAWQTLLRHSALCVNGIVFITRKIKLTRKVKLMQNFWRCKHSGLKHLCFGFLVTDKRGYIKFWITWMYRILKQQHSLTTSMAHGKSSSFRI